MRIYNYNALGEFTGTGLAQESPLEPGVWLMPAHATTIEPPEAIPGKVRVFDGQAWAYQPLAAPQPREDAGPAPVLIPPPPNDDRAYVMRNGAWVALDEVAP